MKHRRIANLLLSLLLVQGCSLADRQKALPGALFSGAWQAREAGQSIRFEPDRILVFEGERLSVRGAEGYGPHDGSSAGGYCEGGGLSEGSRSAPTFGIPCDGEQGTL